MARWNAQKLEGGTSRQDKFMRLLGGKKQGATAAAAGTGGGLGVSRPRLDVDVASKELEQQFDSGIKLKFGLGGQRRGLGM
ncbi:small acidic protein-like domain-containing protein [Lasiosphaeria ovina]|uniref:Small acidic protein n=1 Tax=Lasiosphaeria ovina TaxID=92902 RepID=A0AAE0KD59_9PEZI|nr:small acidic protein-like domain-containing protein [Lasiosphaeria ovina]